MHDPAVELESLAGQEGVAASGHVALVSVVHVRVQVNVVVSFGRKPLAAVYSMGERGMRVLERKNGNTSIYMHNLKYGRMRNESIGTKTRHGNGVLTHHGTDKVVVSVDLEVVLQVRLSQEHTVAVLVGTAVLLRLLVDVDVFPKFILGGERLGASLKHEERYFQ